MLDRLKLIIKKWIQSIVELLVFFPVLLFIGIYAIPHNLLLIWLVFISIYYLIGLLVGQLLKNMRIIILVLIGMIISGVGFHFLFDGRVPQVLSGILGVIAFVRGAQLITAKQWKEIFPPSTLWVGLVEYFIGYFFFSRVETLKPFSMMFNWVGIVYMVLVFFIINFTQLETASLSGDNESVLPKIIKNHNKLLIIIMLIVVGIISFFESLKEGVKWLVNGIIYLILKFITFIADLLASTKTKQRPINSEGGGIQNLLPPIEEKPPSIFDRFIEIMGFILLIMAGLTIIGLIGFLLFKLVKKIVAWLSKFYQLGRDMEDYGGYVDEKESLIDLKELIKNYSDRLHRWLAELMEKELKWDELKTNKERIRYIYRHFILHCIEKGYSFKGYLTPTETGEELSKLNLEKAQNVKELTEVYDCVRYGDKDIDDKKIQKLIQTFLKK